MIFHDLEGSSKLFSLTGTSISNATYCHVNGSPLTCCEFGVLKPFILRQLTVLASGLTEHPGAYTEKNCHSKVTSLHLHEFEHSDA